MVIHQAIRVAEPVIPDAHSVKDFEKGLSILFILKNIYPVIPSTGNMINSTGKLYTQRASHI
jgi:hypothetical protein